LVVLSLVLAAVGCTSDDSSRADAPTTESSGDGSASSVEDEEVVDVAADQQIADSSILSLDDLPPGWESSPPEDDDKEEEELDRQFAECLDVDPDVFADNEAQAESSFASADDEEITSEVSFEPSVEEVAETMELIRREDMPGCYARIVQDGIAREVAASEDDIDVGEVTVNEMSFEDLGDDSIAFRVTVPFSSGDLDGELYFDVVTVAVGRAGINMTFQSTLTPFDRAQALELTQLVVDRVSTSV
jgi:hypothetical protein